jgi:zinc protease
VQRVASAYFKPDNRTVAVYQPVASPERAPTPARVDVAALVKDYKGDPNVAQAEAFEATPANLEARTRLSRLPSGLKVALLPKGTRGRVVQARLQLRFGDAQALMHQGMAVGLMGATVHMGGGGLTRQQLSDRWDQLRTLVAMGASGQSLEVTLTSVREHLPAAITLLGRVLRQPAFPADGLEEARRQWQAGLAQQRQEPGALASNAVGRHGNPYPKGDVRHVATFDELEADLKAVSLAQVKAVHARFLSATAGEFSAVGDLDVDAVQAALHEAFGDWGRPAQAGAPAFERVPQPARNAPAIRLQLPTPDKQNANLVARLSLPLNDTHPDFPALQVANFMLGSGGSSRLWKRIRETEGLSYDVRSSISWNEFEPNSTWNSSAIFAPQNLAKVEAAWREELARSVTQGFTQAELDEARNALLNFRRLSRAQDDSVAVTAASNLYLGRRFTRLQQLDEALQALTLEQVNAAWRRHFKPEQAVVAWAGDFK